MKVSIEKDKAEDKRKGKKEKKVVAVGGMEKK